VHLVGFIVRIYHDAPSPERQTRLKASEEGVFNGVRLCYSVRQQDNNELWQDVIQIFKISLGIMQFIIPS